MLRIVACVQVRSLARGGVKVEVGMVPVLHLPLLYTRGYDVNAPPLRKASSEQQARATLFLSLVNLASGIPRHFFLLLRLWGGKCGGRGGWVTVVVHSRIRFLPTALLSLLYFSC